MHARVFAIMVFLAAIRECDVFLMGCGVCACVVVLRAFKLIGKISSLQVTLFWGKNILRLDFESF